MFDYKHYVSILRWKEGERTALRELYPEVKERLSPVIEIPSEVVVNALNKMTISSFASRVRVEILECWGRQPAFVDLSELVAKVAPEQRHRFAEDFYAQS